MLTIKEWPESERPREKLLDKGASALSNSELLALLLRTGTQNHNVHSLAMHALQHFGSLSRLFNASESELCSIKGLGGAKYVQLQAAKELGTRLLKEQALGKVSLNNASDVRNFLVAKFAGNQREVFGLLLLDTRHQMLGLEVLFQGTINCAAVYPREVVKSALKYNAAAVILTHNHPSGDSQPSQSDIDMTHKLKDALGLIDVDVLDHIIVGQGESSSLAELGLYYR